MENTQVNNEKPPKSATICGIAVETIVASIAANIMVVINAASIQARETVWLGDKWLLVGW